MHKYKKFLTVCSLAALVSSCTAPFVCMAAADTTEMQAVEFDRKDGEYSIQVDLEGGSGKASVTSPTLYMIVDGEKYLPTNEEGMNSVFEIPILTLDEAMPVVADTTAMGTPHEIDYTLTFYSDSIGSKSQLPQEAAKRVVGVAMVIIVGGGILNYFVNKRNRC